MPSLHSPKIEVLIVDDEVQARELLSEFCRAQGYEVATANESRAARPPAEHVGRPPTPTSRSQLFARNHANLSVGSGLAQSVIDIYYRVL